MHSSPPPLYRDPPIPPPDPNMLQALKRLSFAGTSIGQSLVGQGRVLLFYYWLTYSILQRQTPKYQPVESARPSLESLAAPL